MSLICKIKKCAEAAKACAEKAKSGLSSLATKVDALEAKVKRQTRNVYKLSDRVAGVRNREWHDTAPAIPISASTTAAGRAFRLGHDFTLPTTTSSTLNDIRLNDTNNTANLLDIQVLDTFITVPVGGVWLRYSGGSEGYWAFELGYCCGPLLLVDELGYADREDNLSIVGPVFLPEGQHIFRGWNIDSGGTNSSHTAQYSLDGETFNSTVPAGVEFNLEKRTVECKSIPSCDPTPEGYTDCPPIECVPPFTDPLPTDLVIVPQAATSVPLSDNDGGDIDNGEVGNSLDFARADHRHPIKLQDNPGDPVLTFIDGSNGSTMSASVILDRVPTEIGYKYKFRNTIRVVGATGFDRIVVPPIAGFSQPVITGIGTYRNQSITPQDDNGSFGSAPRGPFMGKEAHEWTSTRQVYIGFFRRDNDYTMFVEFWVEYVRLP